MTEIGKKTQMALVQDPDCDDPAPSSPARLRALLGLREAITIAAESAHPIMRSEAIQLGKSVGRRLARSVTAGLDLPPFDQSAMDGYALAGQVESGRYPLTGSDGGRAGDDPPCLAAGQAVRIATGARMPAGADRVILQEHATLIDRRVVTTGNEVRNGANVRVRGEDVRRGDILLPTGHEISPRSIAILAAQGIATVEVLAAPRVAVISCGNELRQPGEALGSSNVFDCNRPMLMALAAQAGADVMDAGCRGDDIGTLAALFRDLSRVNDLVVVSGGSSIGEADLTAVALRDAGAHVKPLKIAMKPGKPALVATLGKATIIGLPGNPVAAFVSWQVLGRAILAKMLGSQHDVLAGKKYRVANELRRRPGRTEFVPAIIIDQQVRFLGPAGSGRLSPLCRAEGLALIEATRGDVLVGETVAFLPFGVGEFS